MRMGLLPCLRKTGRLCKTKKLPRSGSLIREVFDIDASLAEK